MTFHVGQKVVCVDDSGLAGEICLVQAPRTGSVYTIRGFTSGIRHDRSRGTGVLLSGIVNPVSSSGNEHCFEQSRFRPVIERKTDISIFTSMLKPSKVEA